MDGETATDDVIDSIAHIEMHRQVRTKEAGLAVSCREALRKLQELLDGVKAALRRQERDAEGSVSRHVRPAQQQAQLQNARPTPAMQKGRRTKGRPGDR